MKLTLTVDVGDRLKHYNRRQRTIMLHFILASLHDDYASGREERQHDADLMVELEQRDSSFRRANHRGMIGVVHDIRAVEQAIEDQLSEEVNKRDV